MGQLSMGPAVRRALALFAAVVLLVSGVLAVDLAKQAGAATLAVDTTVSVDAKSGVATTPAFSTAGAGELLVALVAGDSPSAAGQTATVSGAGLTWTLVKRQNTQQGTA